MPLLIGLAATVLVGVVDLATWPNHLELKLQDWRLGRFVQPESHPDLVSVVIDDTSLERVGRWPWPRRFLADLVDVCSEVGVRYVVLDITLPEEEPIEVQLVGVTDVSRYEPVASVAERPEPFCIDNDTLLAESLAAAGNVMVPFDGELVEPGGPSVSAAQSLKGRLEPLLRAEPQLTLADVFASIYPDKKLQDESFLLSQLRLAYIQAKSLVYFERFAWTVPAEQVALPIYNMPVLRGPLPEFAQAAAGAGFVSVIEDKDGTVRRIALLGRHGEHIYQQLAFATLCRALTVEDDQIDLSQAGKIVLKKAGITIPVTDNGQMLIAWSENWAGAQQNYVSAVNALRLPELRRAYADNAATLEAVESLSYQLSTVPAEADLDEPTRQAVAEVRRRLAMLPEAEALAAANQALAADIDETLYRLREQLHDKIVLVGSVASNQVGAEDFVVTPISQITPGIVVHRNIINTMLQGAFIDESARWVNSAVLLGLGLAMTMLAGYRRARVSGVALVVLVGLTVAANIGVLVRLHVLLALAGPLAALVAAFASVTFYRQITEGRARRHITSRFKQYAAPAVVDQIVANAKALHLAGELREVTCYFADLAGFTPTSERLGPEKTVQVLNVYLDRMTEVLDRYDATINKFEGDGIFAFFGAPLTLPDHARRACLAAVDAQAALARLVREQQEKDGDFPHLTMRIGISTGQVVVGDCGSTRRFDYTAIGDTVNLAARLESANKAFGTGILVCERARQQAGNEGRTFRSLGRVRVVGKQTPVGLYELVTPGCGLASWSGASSAVDQSGYIALFEAALEVYQRGDFSGAVRDFQGCLAQRPNDRGADLYVEAARSWQENPGPEFCGALDLSQK